MRLDAIEYNEAALAIHDLSASVPLQCSAVRKHRP